MTRTKKNILVFSDWFLPGFKAGGPIRSLANLVNVLQHQFYIVTSNKDHHTSTPYPGIPYNTWVKFADNVQVMYLEDAHITQDVMREVIGAQPFDKIYFNSLFSPRFTLMPLRVVKQMGLVSRCVLAPRGMLKPGALSVKPLKKKIFLMMAKLTGLYRGIIWHATSEDERNSILKHFPNTGEIRIAPNLSDVPKEKTLKPAKNSGELKLVCIARISPEKGILEAIQSLKAIKQKGEISCDFYGIQQNQKYLETCMALAESASDVRIHFRGEIVPTDIPSKLKQYHFLFMPTLGENFGHAIAEALNHCTPVIISDLTPWRGLEEKKAGWDLPLNPETFARTLEKCLSMGNAEYQLWCEGAYIHGRSVALDMGGIEASYQIFE
ncbi:MAG: glycosyltransferase family 4 protein [Flavobacteriales bacterium]|nr:glycosyltransferase family 4 protein [Flavobacteriales bacterium]